MTAIGVPGWCRWRRGGGAVLVVAPHGGRRDPQPPPIRLSPRGEPLPRERKVNDLHTAELAEELADALDAGLIVNSVLDRNQLDLNRISQVAAHAPWFLALIESLLGDILTRHARAEVVFVHGWNVIQPKCDVGVGHRLADAAAADVHAAALTISPGYAGDRLARLHALCAREGIATTFGERYAARHPNNLLQLFRAGADRPAPAQQLAAWADSGRIEAMQLELGVPVRWPGPYRRGFLRAAAAAFTGADGPVEISGGAAPPVSHLPPPASLQLYDPRAGLGLTARVDGAGPDRTSGRVLVFLESGRLALFIGEDPRAAGATADGPRFTPAADGFRLQFAGSALATEDGTLYADLEQGFAASRLCAVVIDLHFRRGLSADFGGASGWVEIDGVRRFVDAPAFARHGILQRPGGAWASQIVLSAAFGGQRALRVRHEFPGAGGYLYELTERGEFTQPLPSLSLCFDGDPYVPRQILVASGGDLCCYPLTRMTITRPLAAHRHARVTFGAARFTRAGAEGFGFYEYARALV